MTGKEYQSAIDAINAAVQTAIEKDPNVDTVWTAISDKICSYEDSIMSDCNVDDSDLEDETEEG